MRAAWGSAHLLPELHRVYDLNFLWARDDAAGLDAAALDAEAARLLGGAGLGHRKLLLEEPAAGRLLDDLVGLGYRPSRHLYQAYASASPPAAPRARVEVAPLEDVLPALERYLLTDPETEYGRDEVTRTQLVEHARIYPGAAATARCFVVRDDAGAVVCWAKLWERGGVAQVEDVVCLAEHRGHGFGRDVVLAATRAALEAGPELVFIVADAEDWPKDLYGRVGFEPIGHIGLGLRHVPVAG